MGNINVDEYFLICKDIEECLNNKNIVMNYRHDFKRFVQYCYRNALFKFMKDCIYELAELYIYLTSLRKYIDFDKVVSNKLDCVLIIMDYYGEANLESFSKIVKSDSFLKIILFQSRNLNKIDKIKSIIFEFEDYKNKYDIYQFSDFVFNIFIAMENKNLTFTEILKQDRLDLKSVEALANLKARDCEGLVLLKIVDKAGLKFELATVDALYRNLKVLGASKREACEIYAERNAIILNEQMFEDEKLLELSFETFYKDCVIVEAFHKLWSCKIC